MIELYNDIFERWVKAIDEIDTIREHREKIQTIKYAPSFRYDLKNYHHSDIRAGGIFYDQQPNEEIDYHIYGFDNNGLPIHVSYEHRWNKIHWEGLYNYSDRRVEYLEFCLETNVPSCIQVVKYENNRKTSFQHFNLNGRGSTFPLLKDSKEIFIERIKNDQYSIISNVERYVYNADRIVKAECFSVSPGLGQFHYEKRYAYDDQGELTEVKSFFPNGSSQLEYVRVPGEINLNTQNLLYSLAERIAESIIESLLKHDIEQPICLLELNYRRLDRYLPLIKALSLFEKEEIISHCEGPEVLELLFITGYNNYIDIDSNVFEQQLQQLIQLMEEREDFDLGTDMLRKTASILTLNKLDQKIAVSDDFVAYAIDWEMEGQEFEEILKECGQSPEIIEEWKAKEWI